MGETDATAGAVQPTEGRKGFWFHEDGTLWRGDAMYVRKDGIIPKACPRLHVEELERWLGAGLLDALARKLEGEGTAWVLRQGEPEWERRIGAVRAGLADARREQAAAARAAVPPAESRKGFWMHDDGTLWRGDAVYVRKDGIIPKACPRLHVEGLERWLEAGLLDAVAEKLESKGTAWVLRQGEPEWDRRIQAVRARLAETRCGAAAAT